MHSSSADCVFGEARLISSTSRRFAKTGPGLNSNSFERWLKTLTPVTSEGSRSGVNCSREKEQSSERARAFASIVFPTPGKSSMIRCPSASRQRTHRRSTSAWACTTRARFALTVAIAAAASPTANRSLRVASSIPREPERLVEDRAGDHVLGSLLDPALAAARDEHDLVVGGVEADVGPGDVVEDDEVELLRLEFRARARERLLPVLGGE